MQDTQLLPTRIDPKYIIPFTGYPVIITQGYNGPYSHKGREINGRIRRNDCYSIDFALPLETTIIASRAGIVNLVETFFDECYLGLNPNKGRVSTNFITIDHLDGTGAIYAHLEKQGELVQRKQFVEQGQPIAITGLSGWIGPIPHLHFAVFKKRKTRRTTVPINFENYHGPLEHSTLMS
ncbi:M23 family metallopeptidase [Candidatus Woesearchaeota archaeon]|nr:M23 family metallopeptidase [Candidatus Woesearchaeota archaeon]